MKITTSQFRIKELMDYYNDSLSDVSRKTGVQKSALSNYIHGVREPRQDKISMIADAYGIDPAWLMGYDVPMVKGLKESITTENFAEMLHKASALVRSSTDGKAIEFAELYLNATPEVQAAVLTLLKSAKPSPESPNQHP